MADGKDTNNTGVGNATDGNGGNNMNTDNAANAGGGGGGRGQKGGGSQPNPKKTTDRDKLYREQLRDNPIYGDAPLNWYKDISSAFGMDTIKKTKTKDNNPDIQAANEKAKADGINNVANLSHALTQTLMQALGKAVDRAVAGAIAKGDGRYKKK